MAECCLRFKDEMPSIYAGCESIVGGGAASCADFDFAYTSVDYSKDPAVVMSRPEDGSVEGIEILHWIAGNPAAAQKLFSGSQVEHLVPPSIIKDEQTKEKIDSIMKETIGERKKLVSLIRYFRERVTPSKRTDSVVAADELFKRGSGKCIEMAMALHGMLKHAGFKCGFAVRHSNSEAQFHVLNFVVVDGEAIYIDSTLSRPFKPAKEGHHLIRISEADAHAYFIGEGIVGRGDLGVDRRIAAVGEIQKLLPGDFHIAFGLAVSVAEDDPSSACTLFEMALEMNPHFDPVLNYMSYYCR